MTIMLHWTRKKCISIAFVTGFYACFSVINLNKNVGLFERIGGFMIVGRDHLTCYAGGCIIFLSLNLLL